MSNILVMNTAKRTDRSLPPELAALCAELGRNVQIARKRRGLSELRLARLAHTSRRTIQRIESGEPGVGLGILASVLWALQLEGDLRLVADPDRDEQGKFLAETRLPQRVREARDTRYDF